MAVEGILSMVGGEILKKLDSQASEYLGMLWGLDDQLLKFRSNVSSIQAVLRKAEEGRIKDDDPSLRDWLEKLRDVYYDAEDVVDEISTEALRREVMTKGKNAKQVRIFFSNSNQLAFNYRMACQVKKINERLDVISQEKDKFHLNPNGESRIPNAFSHPTGMGRETHSSLSGKKVIGRDDDMSKLKELLLAEDEEKVKANVSFIAIVGMGGIGKTTLAKALYNDTDVLNCFDLRIWIWVFDQFDTKTILKKIIESATGQKPKEKTMETLKTKFQEVIEGKKYLLVMDDVWNENKNEWENLENLFMFGTRRSKVLITKRDRKVVPDEVNIFSLKDLREDSSWLLFKEVAFKESDLESINENLIQLGKEISKKCGGIPLVIRHIGRLLYGKTSEEDWVFIKNNKSLNVTCEVDNSHDNVISTLKLSYNYLPPNLKQCFAYTSLFPKEYKIRPSKLIRQWVAQGFIESSRGGKSMEDMGKDYLNELCWRFFYEISSDGIVCMHDVMRDLAREVAGKIYVRGDPNNEYVVSGQTRHISFNYGIQSWEGVLLKLRQAKGLRTVLLLQSYRYMWRVVCCKLIFSSFPRLRVLQIHTMAKSTKRLGHLRYLEIASTDRLPRDISNLVNLRHFVFRPLHLYHMPEGIAKLSCLQTLSSFVFNCKKLKKLREFNELNCFMEELRIINLEQLRSTPSKVNSINLRVKKSYLRLELVWKLGNDDYEGEGDETILEGLEPHPKVENLMIKGYCGVGLPKWLSISPLKNHLTRIDIQHCHRLQHLNQFRHLQALRILYLSYLRSLMSLSEWIGSITSLEILMIKECPKLKSLPEEMQNLKSLKRVSIVDCPEVEERCKEGGEDWSNISHVPDFTFTDTSEYSSDYDVGSSPL